MSDKDVEMPDANVVADDKPAHPTTPLPLSPTASPSSHAHDPTPPLPPDSVDQAKAMEDEEVIAVEDAVTGRTLKADSKSRSASVQAPPAETAETAKTEAVIDHVPPTQAEPASSAPPPTLSKPKSTKQRKSRSPSPLPIPQAPPLRTVRLAITLGGPDNYEVDVSKLALETGQRSPTPPPVKRDTSDSEDDSEHEAQGQPKSKEKTKAKYKRPRNAEYDLADPFIDDSELAIDDRTHFAQTKQQGFYVSSGEVALLKDKSPKKPRLKQPLVLTSAAAASIQPLSHTAPQSPSSQTRPPSRLLSPISGQDGTRESPIALLDDDDTKHPSITLKRKELSTPPSTAGGDVAKKRRKVQLKPFSDSLEASIDTLKVAIAQESFEVKGKFPPRLKPKLQQLALQAIVQGEYNDNFFARMPQLFPYNKFTMTKLIKRLVYPDHHRLLMARQDVLLEDLKKLADAGFEQARTEWARNMSNHRERIGRQEDLAAKGSTSAEPSVHGDENDGSPAPNGDGIPKDSKAVKKPEDQQEKEPPKKYRLTDAMKSIFWELYCLNNECSRLTNEKNQLENIQDSVSEQGMRKGLYQKIIAAFPEGWMTTGHISRDISVLKKRHENEQTQYDE